MAYSYERRQQLARSKGFTSYGQYRRATTYAKSSDEFRRVAGDEIGGRTNANLDAVRVYYQAFVQGEAQDYTLRKDRTGNIVVRTKDGKPTGAKAKWIIDYAGYIDEDEWRRRYPRGIRRVRRRR